MSQPSLPKVTVWLCRDCCCGTLRKHPDVDHDAQLCALTTAAAASHARLVVSKCLNACDQSNVAVVRHSPGNSIWLGGLTSPERTEALAAWLAQGGPAHSPLPERLRGCQFEPREEARCTLEEPASG